jgi:hypothetical protein
MHERLEQRGAVFGLETLIRTRNFQIPIISVGTRLEQRGSAFGAETLTRPRNCQTRIHLSGKKYGCFPFRIRPGPGDTTSFLSRTFSNHNYIVIKPNAEYACQYYTSVVKSCQRRSVSIALKTSFDHTTKIEHSNDLVREVEDA